MESWEAEKAFDKCVPSIAALRVKYPRKVGIEGGMRVSFATAFVVSYKPLILVTNKHVLTCAGLAQIEATFLERPLKDHVTLKVVYIDPVHDFAFCGVATKSKEHNLFDPLYPLSPLSLSSSLIDDSNYIIAVGALKAKSFGKYVGKVITNQANPPNGMDFNINHIEATDKSPKGFSGGPVIDKTGKVVGVVASNFEGRSLHLPSPLIRKVLKVFLAGNKISRGSLNLAFKIEETMLDKEGDEMDEPRLRVVVTRCMGESDKILIGDELSKIRGREVRSLSQVEQVLNGSVGKEISIELLRENNKKNLVTKIRLKQHVENLDDFRVPKVLELSDAILHTPEYNVLMFYGLDPSLKRAMFVADQGYLFKQFHIPLHSLIVGVGNVSLLEEKKNKKYSIDAYTTFLDAIRDCLTRGEYLIPIAYQVLGKPGSFRKVILFQPRWYPTVVYYQDSQQQWRRELINFAELVNRERAASENVRVEGSSNLEVPNGSGEVGNFSGGPGRLMRLLVHVRFVQPFELDGSNSEENHLNQAAGTIIDSSRGLIVCERFLINSSLGDCIVTFDGRRSVIGNILLVHPTHLFSIIKISSTDLAECGIVLPPVQLNDFLSTESLGIAENLTYIGMTLKQSRIFCRNVSVTTKEPIHRHNHIKFSPKNSSYFTTSLSSASNGIGGFFYNEKTKKMVGINAHFSSLKIFCGIQSFSILNSTLHLVRSKLQSVDILPVHLTFPLLGDAKVSHSISNSTEMQLLDSMGEFHRTLVAVESYFHQPLENNGKPLDTNCNFEAGDLILSVNETTVTNLRTLEMSLADDESEKVVEVLNQNGEEKKRTVSYISVPAIEVDEVIIVSGAVFHRPSLNLLSCAQKNTNLLQPAAILSEVFPGSPAASVFKLDPGEIKFVSSVDGERLVNFDHFVLSLKELFKAITEGENIGKVSFNLSDEDLDESEKVAISVKKEDMLFWPPRQLRRDPKTLKWSGKDLFQLKLKPKKSTSQAQKQKRRTGSISSNSKGSRSAALKVIKQSSTNFKNKFKGKRRKSISSV